MSKTHCIKFTCLSYCKTQLNKITAPFRNGLTKKLFLGLSPHEWKRHQGWTHQVCVMGKVDVPWRGSVLVALPLACSSTHPWPPGQLLQHPVSVDGNGRTYDNDQLDKWLVSSTVTCTTIPLAMWITAARCSITELIKSLVTKVETIVSSIRQATITLT